MSINISEEIIKQLESVGFRAAFLPYKAIEQLKSTYDELAEKNKDIQYIQNAVKHFYNHQPPDIPFEPLSFLIVANPCDPARVIFNYEGKRICVPIPPLYHGNKVDWKRLQDILDTSAEGYQTAHSNGISQKLLTVLSGLGKYGRNNICYIEGFGSYFGLKAFYTNIPYKNLSYPLRFLDECENCGSCKRKCPTGAIGESSVIDADKCITMYNEINNPIPEWLPQNVHHTMIGCLRCQEDCPNNKFLSTMDIDTLELNETETRTLLTCKPDSLPEELKLKLKQFEFDDHFISIARRNANLALKNCSQI